MTFSTLAFLDNEVLLLISRMVFLKCNVIFQMPLFWKVKTHWWAEVARVAPAIFFSSEIIGSVYLYGHVSPQAKADLELFAISWNYSQINLDFSSELALFKQKHKLNFTKKRFKIVLKKFAFYLLFWITSGNCKRCESIWRNE